MSRYTAAALFKAPSGSGGDASAANQLLIMGTTFATGTDSLEAIRNRGDAAWITSAGAGSGAWTVTITVDDGTNPLEGAKVRMTQGAETYLATTNASGIAVFSLDTFTWTVVITKPLYTFTSTTLAVAADTAQTYSMTAESIPASNPGQVTGFLHVYDENGAVEASVTISLRTLSSPGEGMALDAATRTATSDANGLVTFINLFVGTTYDIRRGTDRPWKSVSIPSTASGSIALDNILGVDS